jgi:exopolysaccharide biosynthesis WecB/TagA/CpsF family protein
MTGVLSAEQKYRLNHFDLLAPDGQPVRWALNLLHGAMLRDRVYGPKLMLNVCEHAEREGLGVYLYGSTQEILAGLKTNLVARFPRLMIRGTAPSKFRPLSSREKDDVALQIRSSGARMIFVGLGCPRQEVWAYEFGEGLSMPIVAVGAAFAFLAGRLRQAPDWMQERGLEWLFRLGAEPKRLWRRYLLLNPAYILLVALQAMGLARFATDGQQPSKELLYG